MFTNYPELTLLKIQHEMLKHNGKIDLSKKTDIKPSEFRYFSITMLSLNNKKYPLNKLILNDCELTDATFSTLVPLICNFKTVFLNGSQKIGISGWTDLMEYVKKHGCKIEKLELKIAKSKASALKLGRQMEDFEEMAINQASWEVNDEVMKILAPTLARIREVHLGQNFIKGKDTK